MNSVGPSEFHSLASFLMAYAPCQCRARLKETFNMPSADLSLRETKPFSPTCVPTLAIYVTLYMLPNLSRLLQIYCKTLMLIVKFTS